VYKNIFNNTTFIFIRLEYIEVFSIDSYYFDTCYGVILLVGNSQVSIIYMIK